MLSKRQQEVLDSMEPGRYYKPKDLGTSQRTMTQLWEAKKVRRLKGDISGPMTLYESGATYQLIER